MNEAEEQDAFAQHTKEEMDQIIMQLCNIKAEEFELFGYDQVTGVEIWECVSDGYKKGFPAMHQLVSDILTLKTTSYMNWMTMNVVYKGARL
jgi:hypothetical protein